MSRLLVVALALVLACGPVAPAETPARSSRVPDIERGKIDIAYSGLLASYYKPNGRDLLTAALEAIRRAARASGGRDDVATPEFAGAEETQLVDFRAFATAAEELAAKNPQLAAPRISTAAIRAMIALNPDCHTSYMPARPVGASLLAQTDERSTKERSDDVPARAGASRGGLARPLDQRGGLTTKMLPGGVAYLGWRSFMDPGVFDDVRKSLDELLAQGARAWLFDLRDNGGGTPPQQMVSWFVNGGVIYREVDRDGRKTPQSAKTEFFLPERYQLPIAVVVNRRTASSPEFFTLALQQRGRAKVFGARTGGCLGSTAFIRLRDGSVLAFVQSVYVGPASDEPVNNEGITPDTEVTSDDPVEIAAAYLRSLAR